MTTDQAIILRAMYHRTRKCWPEWTAAELAARVRRPFFAVVRNLTDLERAGLIEKLPYTGNQGMSVTYRVSEIGKRVVAKAVAA